MQSLVRRFVACLDIQRTASDAELEAEAQALAAYGIGASEADCPYSDQLLAAAWLRSYRRAGLLDASVW